MRRADSLQAVAELPMRLRQAVPGLVLRTTCLVGFPGETESHVQHLLKYVAEARFDHLGAFAYSPEEGTPACDIPDAPSSQFATSRRDRLLRVQQDVVAQRQSELIGAHDIALLMRPTHPRGKVQKSKQEKAATGEWIARLSRQAPEVDGITRVTGVPADAQPGAFVRVRITGGHVYDLTATVVAQGA